MVKVECISNEGFEDSITVGRTYVIIGIGENGFKIINDKLKPCWYGTMFLQYERGL